MPMPTQTTTGPLDGLRMVANATPPGQVGGQPGQPTGGEGRDHGVPPALPHPPPVMGGLSAGEPGALPPDAQFIERAGIVHNQEGDYVSGYVAGVGRLVRSPITLTTLQVGHTLYDQDGTFMYVISLAELPATE